ncbi:hypothetical protein R3P38DRAFT_1628799 [Favolaschia claudopus]|uniref:MYND-type domain-containing protein n=1 Tax=Favolaschia claudopus TaxID=2862362 RepID=A0AAW0DI12_9AGAR
MHESLDIKSYTDLAPFIRQAAVSAASGDHLKLVVMAEERKDRSTQRLLLALLHKNLSTTSSLIPGFVQALDSATVEVANDKLKLLEACVSRVLHSLLGVSFLRFECLDHESFKDLDILPPSWKWIQFLDTYRDVIALVIPSFDVPQLYYASLAFLAHIGNDGWVANTLSSQCRPRKLFARAWVCLLNSDYDIDHFSFLYLGINLDRFTVHGGGLDEFIDGVEGKAVLVAILVDYIERVTSSPAARHNLQYLVFVAQLFPALAEDTKLMTSLCQQGIVKTITSALSEMASEATTKEAVKALDALLFTLHLCLRTTPEYQWVAQSLQSGLVSAITAVCCVSVSREEADLQWLNSIVESMTLGLVFKFVLLQVRAEWPRIESAYTALQGHAMFEKWHGFTRLAEIRLQTLTAYEKGDFSRHRVCSNSTCAMMAAKTAFRRCSACSLALYCSKACQSHDWHFGDHSDYCKRYKSVQLSMSSSLDVQEKSFLRALLYDTYLSARRAIMAKRMEFARCSPDRTLIILFDYTSPDALRIECAVGVLPDDPPYQIFADMVQRNGGRLELHAIRIRHGGAARTYLIPMHFETDEKTAALQKLAKSEASSEADREGIEKILGLSGVEIYGDVLGDLSELGVSTNLGSS